MKASPFLKCQWL